MSSILSRLRRRLFPVMRYWHFVRFYDPPDPDRGPWEVITTKAASAEAAIKAATSYFGTADIQELSADEVQDLQATPQYVPRTPVVLDETPYH